jgi:hypothetical protein
MSGLGTHLSEATRLPVHLPAERASLEERFAFPGKKGRQDNIARLSSSGATPSADVEGRSMHVNGLD